MKKLLSLLLALSMLLACFTGMAAAEGADTINVNILHTNDIHGAGITPPTEKMIRYSQIATMKQTFENAILVDGGDYTQGTAYVALTDGLAVINAMRLAGYDVATLGNHEFTAYRSHFITSCVSESGEGLVGSPVAIVANNVFGEPVLETQPKVFIAEREGVKIGFFGLATPTTLTTGNPAVNVGITIGNVCDAAKAAVEELKAQGAEIIVCVAHLGYDPAVTDWNGDSSVSVATNVEGIDVIIDAHFHQSLMGEDSKWVGDTLITSTGTGAVAVGRVELKVDAASHELISATSSAITAAEAYTAYPEDETVKAYLDEAQADVDAVTGETFIEIPMALYGGHYRVGGVTASIARRGETNASALQCDGKLITAQRYFAGTEYEDLPIVSLVCGGSTRAYIPAGGVKVSQIMNLCLNAGLDPSGVYVKTTGAVLWEAVEWGLSCIISQDAETGAIKGDGSYHGRFPNLGGATYVFDARKPGSTPLDFDAEKYVMGERLVSITLADGTVITKDSDVELIIATNDFELGGGDGYFCFQRAEEAGKLEKIGVADITFMDATINYMKELQATQGQVYYPLTSGRVTCISDYDGRDFPSVVTVLKADETAYAGAEAELFVNYGTAEGIKWVSMGTFTTDENGQFTAMLKKGPQETKVVIGGVESNITYVDNLAGMLNTTVTVK